MVAGARDAYRRFAEQPEAKLNWCDCIHARKS
jgi:hypothetical protein